MNLSTFNPSSFKIRASQVSKIMSSAKKAGELSETCKTYLKEWYAETLFGDREDIRSKYLDKGNFCEASAIDLCALQLGYGLLSKCEESRENEFLTGTCDVLTKTEILDTKCSWNSKTFIDSVVNPLSLDYYWQMIAYAGLYGRKSAKVCFCLMDTPAEANFGKEVSYSHIPQSQRFHAKEVIFEEKLFEEIEQRVNLCREFLTTHHQKVLEGLGA